MSIATQLETLEVTDTLKHASGMPATFTKLPWAVISEGQWGEFGWNPITYSAEAAPASRCGAYHNSISLNGSAAIGITRETGSISNADRRVGLWLFTQAEAKPSGYQLQWITISKTEIVKLVLTKWVEGKATILKEVAEAKLAEGDSFYLVADDGVLSIWRQTASKTPEQIAEVEDSTFKNGRIAIDGNGSNPRMVNLVSGKFTAEVGVTLTPETRRLDFELCDRNQNVLNRLDNRRAGAKVKVGLNRARTGSCPLSLEESARELASAVETLLRVTLIGPEEFRRVMLIGRITIPESKQDLDSAQLELNATDPLFQLDKSLVRKVVGSTWESLDFTGIDQSVIMWELIKAAEDHGVIEGDLAAASVKRDRTYPPGKEVGLALVQMSEVIDGPDFELEPVIAGDGTLAQFNTFYPKLGSDLTEDVVFVFGDDPESAAEFVLSPGGDEIVNRVVVVGAPYQEPTEESPYTLYNGYVAEHAESIAQYGVFEKKVSFDDVSEPATLQQHAEAIIAASAYPVPFFDFKPAPEQADSESAGLGVPPRFGQDYWVGDTIAVEAFLGGSDTATIVHGRITDATLTERESGQLQVELTCSAEIKSTGITGKAITIKIPGGEPE